MQFFAERVEDPTDNKPARCLAIVADAHPRLPAMAISRNWPWRNRPSRAGADDCFTAPILVGLTFDEYAILDARGRFPKCAIRSSAHC